MVVIRLTYGESVRIVYGGGGENDEVCRVTAKNGMLYVEPDPDDPEENMSWTEWRGIPVQKLTRLIPGSEFSSL